MIKIDRTDAPTTDEYATVYVAFELSKSKWKLGVMIAGSEKMSRYTIGGGDLAALTARLVAARTKAERSGKPVRFVSCYEAGFDGHWLHRWLTDQGVVNYEIDPSSIAVNRRARRAKTDRIDLEQMMRALLAYLRGEPRVCSVVRVPTIEDEDRKRRNRERERLLKERTAHTNRIKGLLHAQGIRDAMPLKAGFIDKLDSLRTGDSRALTGRLREEIVREHERLCLVSRQLAALEASSRGEQRAAAPGSAEAKIVHLAQLKGIGRLRQPPPGRQLFRADRHALRQRTEPARPGHQQSRQPPRPRARDRAGLAVGPPSARQRIEPLVPRARARHQGPLAAHHHRGGRTQAHGGTVAISPDRRGAHRRGAASEPVSERDR